MNTGEAIMIVLAVGCYIAFGLWMMISVVINQSDNVRWYQWPFVLPWVVIRNLFKG